jgi:hypothetical protein
LIAAAPCASFFSSSPVLPLLGSSMPPRPKSPSQRMPFVWRWRRLSQSLPLVGRVPRRGGRGLCCREFPTLRHAAPSHPSVIPALSRDPVTRSPSREKTPLPRLRGSFRLTDVRRLDPGSGAGVTERGGLAHSTKGESGFALTIELVIMRLVVSRETSFSAIRALVATTSRPSVIPAPEPGFSHAMSIAR